LSGHKQKWASKISVKRREETSIKEKETDRSIDLEEWRGEAEKSNHRDKESNSEKIERRQQILLSSASRVVDPICILLYTLPLTPTPPLPLAAASLPFLFDLSNITKIKILLLPPPPLSLSLSSST
jgi:hypothetical protein